MHLRLVRFVSAAAVRGHGCSRDIPGTRSRPRTRPQFRAAAPGRGSPQHLIDRLGPLLVVLRQPPHPPRAPIKIGDRLLEWRSGAERVEQLLAELVREPGLRGSTHLLTLIVALRVRQASQSQPIA